MLHVNFWVPPPMMSPNPGQEALLLQAQQRLVCLHLSEWRNLGLLLRIQRCFLLHKVTAAPSFRERNSRKKGVFVPCPQLMGNRSKQKAVAVGQRSCIRERPGFS